jgi:hypothetical protein
MDGSRKQAARARLHRATVRANLCAQRVQIAPTPLAKAQALEAVIEANETIQDAAVAYLQALNEYLEGREGST